MQELRIGVIGAGAIGQEHIQRISGKLSGGRIAAVTDVDRARAERALASISGARVCETDDEVISSPDVDAVMVCSWGLAHAGSVLKAIAASKPVFCEKPLATTAAECKEIVDAEMACGKKLVQVGFQRRYDKGYLQMKGILDSGVLGAPLMIHAAHRNASVADNYNTPMAVNDTAIHEIDCLHWLLGDQYKTAQVIYPRPSRHGRSDLRDPQLMILTTESGVVIDLEVFVTCRYGYDIQCEICCEEGIVKLPEPSFPVLRQDARRSVALETDWKERFIESYDVEIQDWLDSVRGGKMNGPSAWDGYVAAVTADALVRSQESGAVESVVVGAKPAFYR